MSWLRVVSGGAALVCALLAATPSRAQQPLKPEEPAQPKEQEQPEEQLDPPIDKDDERPLPDYDGRDEPTTAGDVLIWIPRVILSPLYFVSEFIIRRPLGWLITAAEREDLPTKIIDFFTFEERKAGVVPTALFDFELRPSVGLYFFWDDLGFKGHKQRLHAAYGGSNWLKLTVAERIQFWNQDHEVGLRGEYWTRPDGVFHGFGPSSRDEDRGRYKFQRIEGGFTYDALLWRSSEFRSFVAVRDVSFDGDVGCCGDHTVLAQVALGNYPEPPGLDDGYTIALQGVTAEIDTRRRRAPLELPDASDFVSPPGTGVKLQIRGEHATGLRDTPRATPEDPSRYHWVKYGATVGGFADLTGDQRVLGLSLIADFADPLDEDGDIPFTEQVTLGGSRPMRGFLAGRLVDRSAAVAVLEYQWPVWVWMDGALTYSVGNVFGEHLDDFELALLRQSYGLGLRTTGSRDHVLEFLLAFGTETFDDGASIESVRIVLGATSGF
jgi:hypothetical protein